MLCDNPKELQRYENTYYDPEYDAWEKEFDQEQANAQSNVELPDPDTVKWSGKTQTSSAPSTLETERYETYDTEDINDWEKED